MSMILRLFGEHDEPWRVCPHEHTGCRWMSAYLGDLEPDVVQHPTELVQRIEANGVVELPGAAVVEHHHALYSEAAVDEINPHFVHAHAPLAFEPHQAGLPLGHEVAVGHVEQEHPALAQ